MNYTNEITSNENGNSPDQRLYLMCSAEAERRASFLKDLDKVKGPGKLVFC